MKRLDNNKCAPTINNRVFATPPRSERGFFQQPFDPASEFKLIKLSGKWLEYRLYQQLCGTRALRGMRAGDAQRRQYMSCIHLINDTLWHACRRSNSTKIVFCQLTKKSSPSDIANTTLQIIDIIKRGLDIQWRSITALWDKGTLTDIKNTLLLSLKMVLACVQLISLSKNLSWRIRSSAPDIANIVSNIIDIIMYGLDTRRGIKITFLNRDISKAGIRNTLLLCIKILSACVKLMHQPGCSDSSMTNITNTAMDIIDIIKQGLDIQWHLRCIKMISVCVQLIRLSEHSDTNLTTSQWIDIQLQLSRHQKAVANGEQLTGVGLERIAETIKQLRYKHRKHVTKACVTN